MNSFIFPSEDKKNPMKSPIPMIISLPSPLNEILKKTFSLWGGFSQFCLNKFNIGKKRIIFCTEMIWIVKNQANWYSGWSTSCQSQSSYLQDDWKSYRWTKKVTLGILNYCMIEYYHLPQQVVIFPKPRDKCNPQLDSSLRTLFV